MPMTMTEKILAAASHEGAVHPGQLIMADLSLVLGNDITSPVAIKEFPKFGKSTVFDKDKVALVPDHFTPNKDIKAAEQCACVRAFATKESITNYFEVGQMGVEHALLPEKGLVSAGDVVIGADSHTCTYGALGAFSTGVGSTDMAAGMATGKAWFKVPSAIRFNLTGSLRPYVSGKDFDSYIFEGNVKIAGTDFQGSCDKVEARMRLSKSGKRKITLIILKDNLKLSQGGGENKVSAGRGEILPDDEMIVLSESPAVENKDGSLVRGKRIIYKRGRKSVSVENPQITLPRFN